MAGHLDRIRARLKRLWRGARWSEEYGSHPGTPPLLVMIAAGAIAGADRNPLWEPLLGGGLFAALYGPLWLIGCWHRGDARSGEAGPRLRQAAPRAPGGMKRNGEDYKGTRRSPAAAAPGRHQQPEDGNRRCKPS